MEASIDEYQGSASEDAGIASLLDRVYVQAGFTDPTLAGTMFALPEIKRWGQLILATWAGSGPVGMIICAGPDNPYRQVANADEAEMQLLAVAPEARQHGIGRSLCLAFETNASAMGYRKAVLSTQAPMHAAHALYASLGYARNAERDWQRAGRHFLVYEKSLLSRRRHHAGTPPHLRALQQTPAARFARCAHLQLRMHLLR